MIKLDRHIEILLLSHDCVIVPGFGGFMTHYVDAKFDDRDNMFLPPLRTLGFNQQLVLNDSLLAQSYVEAYDISYPEALSLIAEEVAELRLYLKNEGRYELNDLGVLYYSTGDIYTFEPFESGILTPELYGLNTLEIPQLAALYQSAEEQEYLPIVERATSKREANADAACSDKSKGVAIGGSSTKKSQKKEGHILVSYSLLRNLSAACIAIMAFLLFPMQVGDPKGKVVEGSVVNTSMLTQLMPQDVLNADTDVALPVTKAKDSTTVEQAVVARTVKEKQVEVIEETQPYYTIVLASRITKANAMNYVSELHKKGVKSAEILLKGKSVKVVAGKYATMEEAYQMLNSQQNQSVFSEAWVLKVAE